MSGKLPRLHVREITDRPTSESFENLNDFLREESPLLGFSHVEITFTQAVNNFRYTHKLGYAPKDIIQTRLTGTGTLTWNYSAFTAEFLDITTTGPCVVRAFVGTYQEKPGA